jgi:hypothetical protein
MAFDEMQLIREPDAALLDEHKSRIFLYFAEVDHWVGDQREKLLQTNVDFNVVHDVHGTPHAFCINHGESLARVCFEWMISLGPELV